MPLDAVCITALTNELAGKIVNMKIDKIQQPERDEIQLNLRGWGSSSRLLISAGTGDARIHLTDAKFENPASPPMFCMLLRKYLAGGKITGISQPWLERAVDIEVESPDAMGEISTKHIIVEMMGRYSNIILTAGDGLIIDCLRRVDAVMSEKRQLLPGLLYRLPPKQDKLDPVKTDRDGWKRLFDSAPSDRAGDKWILDTFAGLPPLICREIVYRAYGETDAGIGAMRDKDRGAGLIDAACELMENINSGGFVPFMLTDADGMPKDFSYTEITQYENALTGRCADGFSSLLDEYYTRRAKEEKVRQRASAMTKLVKNAHERVVRKLSLQKEELKATQDRERMRKYGDIITANIYAMKKGMTQLKALDFYSENGAECEIKLDPLKTPQQNAAKYYRDYTKAKNAEKFLTEQIEIGQREQEYLESVLEEIRRAQGEKDLSEIRRELIETGYIKLKKNDGKERRAPQRGPMRFVSGTGMEIRVGRNNSQNDRLTLKESSKTDVWLHAQKIHGSHVIISTGGTQPDEATLYEAASLAALYSQAGESGKVPVDYTLVKYVKKPNGARPGMVIYTDYKTIAAMPDKELAERLRKDKR